MIPYRTKKKIKAVCIIASILLGTIGVKLVYTNIYLHNELTNKATDLWERSFPLSASRGIILDRNLTPLVYNEPTTSLAFIPNQIKDKGQTAKLLAPYLNIKEEKLLEKISKNCSILLLHPEGKQLNFEIASKIKKLNIEGVYLVQDNKRVYPYNESMASLLGFVGIDNDGLSGLESHYNSYLKGKPGSLNYLTDAKGHLFPNVSSRIVAPMLGFNLSLSLDLRIQNIIEREMTNAQIKYQPEEIIALVSKPSTGEILAIGNRPTYNNNNYQDFDPTIYNRVLGVFSSFEPGSTFKAMTFAAAINEHKIDIDKDTYYDKGYEVVEGKTIKSWKKGGHGLQTYLEVLQNSSNPGFVEISRKLGKDTLYKYINDYGFGQKTNIDITGENKGIVFSYDKFGPLEVATSCFGQGISVTPIQLMMAFNSTINGGYLLTPHVASEIRNSSTNEVIFSFDKTIKKKVLSDETSLTMRRALESVVALGSGRKAYVDGYRIGGKTGTAQIASNGAYLDGQYILSFIAAAPMSNPEISIYFAMKKPKNCVQYGGTTVGPIIKTIMEEALPILNVKKDYSGLDKVYTWMDVETKAVPNFIGMDKDKIKSRYFKIEFVGSGNKAIDQLPKVNEKIEIGKTVLIMLGD